MARRQQTLGQHRSGTVNIAKIEGESDARRAMTIDDDGLIKYVVGVDGCEYGSEFFGTKVVIGEWEVEFSGDAITTTRVADLNT